MVYEKVITELDDLRKSINQETQKNNDTMVGILKDLNDGWWIPAEERSPKNDVTVLVSLENGKVVMGYNHNGTWMTKTCENSVALSGVEAWMAMPSPYSKGEKKHHHHKG